jgi:hypothetical protein
MQAVISSFPHFSQTSAGRLSFVCQLFTRHRTSTGTHRVHQYTSSLTSNAFPPGGLPPPHSTHIAVAAAMRLSVQVSTTRLPLTNILYVTRSSSGFNLLFTQALDYPTLCYRGSRPVWRAPGPVCPEQGSYQQYVLYPMSISPPSKLTFSRRVYALDIHLPKHRSLVDEENG